MRADLIRYYQFSQLQKVIEGLKFKLFNQKALPFDMHAGLIRYHQFPHLQKVTKGINFSTQKNTFPSTPK